MKCPECDAQNPETVEFCKDCNARIPLANSDSPGRERDDLDGHATRPQEHTYHTRKAILSVLAVFVLIIASVSVYLAVMDNSSDDDLAFRGPITIMTDDHFTSANGVTSGSGTEQDPFVIEGWTIEVGNRNDLRYGIYVGWTTAHFIIKNVTLTKAYMNVTRLDSSTGILVWGPSNGTITGCNISNMEKGIEIREAHDVTIAENSISGCYYGISAWWNYERGGSRDIKAEGNYFTDNYRACYVEGSSSFEILRNEFTENDRCVVLHKVSDTIIKNNTILRGNWDGFWISYSRNIDVLHNNATVSGTCIYIVYSNQTSVRENTISGDHIGLRMFNTDNVTVVENHFRPFRTSISYIAVWMDSSGYVTVVQNDFEYCHIGVFSISCSSPSVYLNTFNEVEIEIISVDLD